MTNLTQDLIDAVVADLNTNAGLPDHGTYKYGRPKVILPEDCPLLVVWLIQKNPAPLTTVWFDARYTLGVSWHEDTVEQAETLVGDVEQPSPLLESPTRSTNIIEALSLIEERVRVWATDGLMLASPGSTVDAAYQVLPGQVTYAEPRRETGLTEGWWLNVTVDAVED